MTKKTKKRKVLTTKGACEVLGIKVAWFHANYRQKLTKLPSTDNKAYYDYNEVVALKSSSEKKVNIPEGYEVVK